ncbi:MAG: BspA family leucine-rich repeat surface protein, partial [Lachnospiraceae bacterium]|nr:BspA family leucine-rich repeat surface protein [Lachnospiraceae bacterium]
TDIEGMFENCYELTDKVAKNFFKAMSTTVKLENVKNLFKNCRALVDLDLSTFDTTETTDMSGMFEGCENVKVLNLGSFDTANVTNMTSMFEGCENLEDILVDGAKFVTTNVTESTDMFKDCVKLTGKIGSRYSRFGNQDVTFARIDTGWDTTTPGYFGDVNEPRIEAFWRNNKDAVSIVSGADWIGEKAWTSLGFAPGWYEELGFALPKEDVTSIKLLKESQVRTFDRHSLTEEKYVNMYLGNDIVATYSFMLKGTELYVTNGLDASGDIYNLNQYRCYSFYFPTYLEDISGLFEGFTNLESIMDDNEGFYSNAKFTGPFILSHVKTAKNVFKDCHKLKMTNFGINVHADNLEDIEGMFENCYELPSDVVNNFFKYMNTDTRWTTKLENMKNLFKNCRALVDLDLATFDTTETTDMTSMFEGATELTTIIVTDKFKTDAVTSDANMFSGCTKLVGGENTKYNVSHVNSEYARIDKIVSENIPGYFTESGKEKLNTDPTESESSETSATSASGESSESGESGESTNPGESIAPSETIDPNAIAIDANTVYVVEEEEEAYSIGTKTIYISNDDNSISGEKLWKAFKI